MSTRNATSSDSSTFSRTTGPTIRSRTITKAKSMINAILLPFRQCGYYVGYHHYMMLFLGIMVIFLSLLLAGCSSSSSFGSSVYVMSLSYTSQVTKATDTGLLQNITSAIAEATMDSNLQVRLGYFGICASSGEFWNCQGSAHVLSATGRFNDPLDILSMAERYKSEVLFPGLIFGSIGLVFIIFILLSTFANWHVEVDRITGSEVDVKPFPSLPVLTGCVFLSILAALFCLVSALWQHTSAASAATTMEVAGFGAIKAHIGGVATTFVWLGFGFMVIVMMMLFFMSSSMHALIDSLED